MQTLPVSIQHVEGMLVLACIDHRLKLIDVNKMVVLRSFQGRLCGYPQDCTRLISSGKGWCIVIIKLVDTLLVCCLCFFMVHSSQFSGFVSWLGRKLGPVDAEIEAPV